MDTIQKADQQKYNSGSLPGHELAHASINQRSDVVVH